MVRRRPIFAGLLLAGATIVGAAIAVGACQPTLNDTVSIVTAPSVLAVQSNPAEATRGTLINYAALVVDGNGPVSSAPLQWDYCNARNPLSNLGPINTPCEQPNSGQLALIGRGVEVRAGVTTAVPDIACNNFGPLPPQIEDAAADSGPGRPVDPDSTGGFYQPVSVFLPESGGSPQLTLYQMRVACGFSGADEMVTQVLTTQYHLNVNPQVESLTLVQNDAGGAALVTDTVSGKANAVRAGQKVTFRVSWPACPIEDICGDGVCGANESTMNCPNDCVAPSSCSAVSLEGDAGSDAGAVDCLTPLYSANVGAGLFCPHDCEKLAGGCPPGCQIPAGCPAACGAPRGCAGAERYVNLDLMTQSAVFQREGIHASWFATVGTFDNDRTGRDGTDDTTTSDNGWTAPSSLGAAHLWVVLRDDRGGIGWAGYALDVTN